MSRNVKSYYTIFAPARWIADAESSVKASSAGSAASTAAPVARPRSVRTAQTTRRAASARSKSPGPARGADAIWNNSDRRVWQCIWHHSGCLALKLRAGQHCVVLILVGASPAADLLQQTVFELQRCWRQEGQRCKPQHTCVGLVVGEALRLLRALHDGGPQRRQQRRQHTHQQPLHLRRDRQAKG